MHATEARQTDLENLEESAESLPEDLLNLVAGGTLRTRILVDFCYDEHGNVVDVSYIDL